MFNTTSIQNLEPARQRLAALMAEYEQSKPVVTLPNAATSYVPRTLKESNHRNYIASGRPPVAKPRSNQPKRSAAVAKQIEEERIRHEADMARRRDKFREQCRRREKLRKMADAL